MRNYLRLIAILLFCIGMHFSNAQTDSIPIQNNDSVTQSQQEMQTEKNNKVSELENTI